ncbi:MAG: hypothetical protein DWH87_00030 [Planctomycetota bacterium]|nr:MAG: hypothetical protein DWH87_00030 [Planctomycetota bacterium]
MKFGSIFNRFSRELDASNTPGSAARLARRKRMRGQDVVAAVESLEDRRLLAFQYVGFTHTQAPPTASSPQAYQYNFEVFNDNSNPNDSATMYMRNMNITGQLQFDYGTTFSSLTNLGSGLTGAPSSLTPPFVTGWNWGTRNPNTENPNAAFNIEGPVSLINSNSIDTNWNTRDTAVETFILSKVRVFAAPGTVNPTFVLHVGDKMPLSLDVDFSQAVGTSTIIIRSDTQETYPESRAEFLPHGGGYDFRASEIYIRAAVDPKPQYTNNYAAENLIQIENSITSGLTARVKDGDFKLLAGASISGTTDIRLGAGIPPTAFSPYSQYGYGGNGGDILIDGEIRNAGFVNLQVNSVNPRNILTGPSGLISGGASITLNNAGANGGVIDVRTADFAQHNLFAGTNVGPAADIAININQIRGDLTINALPASKATISLTASQAGRQVITNSNFDTVGGLSLSASTLNVNRPLSTQQGDINLTGNSVTIGSNVSAGTTGIGNLNVVATGGNIAVTSAAVVKATGDSINLTASGSIASQARLEATNVKLTAGGSIDTLTRTDTVTATAGGAIRLSDDDALTLTDVTTTGAGTITVDAKGLLTAVSVATGGTGDIVLTTTAAGLIANDLRTTNGTIRLRALDGDISAVGDVFVNDANPASPTQDFVLTADKGNVIMSPDATFTVADQLTFNAPLGRVLTPGRITGVLVTNPGSGYVTPPAVSFNSGSGAVVTPTVGDGKVTFVKVLNGGSGYVTAPSVVFANAGTGGSGAVATAQITAGVVTGITITNGGLNYTSAPTISFVGGSGSGAEAVASINGLTALSVPPGSGGSGYQVPPTVVISSGDGSSTGAVTVDASGAITSINVAQGGTAYTAAPEVVIVDSSGAGFGAVATATLTGGVTNGVAVTGGSGYTGAATATVTGASTKPATGIPLLGLTTASVTGFASAGSSYAVGDLLTVVAGSGAQIDVTAASGGAITAATVSSGRGGVNYGVGDTLYLNDPTLGANGARLRVSTVTTGGVITAVTVLAGGTGYTTEMLLNHVGGTGAVLEVTGVDFGGGITDTVVYRAGSGYTTRPSAVVGGSGSGAVPTFVDTQYTVVGYKALLAGTGYSSASISVSGGTGAVVTAGVEQIVDTIVVANPGTAYNPATTTITLAPVASGGGATSNAVTVDGIGSITSINLATDGKGYVKEPTVSIVDRSGSGSGAKARAITSQGVTAITLSSAGAGYATAPTVTISGGGGSGATAVATITNGYVTGITILEPGSGYSSTPTVTFTGGGATQQAVATAATSFVVTGIVLDSSGSAYNPSATDVILNPVGSGATGVANVTGGVVTSIRITDNGSGYSATTPPTVTIVPFGQGALATSALSGGGVGAVTVTNPGTGYAVDPQVVFTPNLGGTTAVATIGGVAQLAAKRLSWTALEQPLDALLAQFSVAGITLTGAGDLTINRPSSDLTLEGAVTKDGSVFVTAQKLTVTGAVIAGDFNSSRTETVKLVATGSDLIINAPVTAPAAVSLEADAGAIIGSQQGLVTTKALDLLALNGATVTTKVESVTGKTTGAGAGITIDEADDLTVGTAKTPLSANNGPISVTAGGVMSVNAVNAGPSGSVTLVAGSNLIQAVSGDAAEVVAATANLTSKQGRIDLDTDVQTLSASAPNSTIDIDNISTLPVTLQNVSAANNVRVFASSQMTAQSVTSNLSNVTLTTLTPTGTTAANSILAGSISALKGVVTLTATGDVLSADPTGTAPNVFATTARVSAIAKADGLINLRTAVGTLGAQASSTITISELDAITLGEPTGPVGFQAVRSLTGSVIVTAGGTLTATDVQATTSKQSVKLTSTGGGIQLSSVLTNAANGEVTVTANKSITDTDNTVDVTAKNVVLTSQTGSIGAVDAPIQLSVATVTASAPGSIYVSNDQALSITSITGGTVGISANGGITQTGVINAASLAVTGNGAAIVLDSQANTLGAFGATNPASPNGPGSVVVKDTSGSLDMLASNVERMVITAAGPVTQSGAIRAPRLTVQGNFKDAIALDTQPNAIGTFAASNGSGGVGIKDAEGALDIAFIQGGPVNIVVDGPLTQSGFINATALTVAGNGAAITLDTQTNNVDSFGAVNPSGSVVFQDATGGLVLTKSNAGLLWIKAAGAVTQSAPIVAANLTVQGTGVDPITLDTQDNDLGSVAIANGLVAPVSIKDTIGALNVAFLDGGPVTLTVAGGLTQSGAIQSTDLIVNGGGNGPITLTNAGNKANTFKASNGTADITFSDSSGNLALAGLDGGNLVINAVGDITQTAAVTGNSLNVNSSTGGVKLVDELNEVDTVTGTAVKDFVYTNFGTFAAGPITVSGTTSNIVLSSVVGDVNVVGNLTATNLVTLDATNGTFVLVPPAVISAQVLSYNTLTPPTYDPAAVPDTIAVDGNLTINKPGQAVTFGNFASTGTIMITADSITVTGPLVTTGTNQAIELTALTGGVTFVGTGSAENAPALGGTTSVTAAGAITGGTTNPLSGDTLTLSSGGAITLPGVLTAKTLTATSTGGAIALANAKNDFDTVTVTNGTRAVTLTDVDDLAIAGITGGAVALTVGDHLTQSGAIVATSLTANSTTKNFGNMILFNANNDVGTLTIDNGPRVVYFTDKNGVVIGGMKAGDLTLSTAGAMTQTGPIVVTGPSTITNTAGAITLNNNNNDFASLKVSNATRNVTVVDKNDISIAGVTAGQFTLATVGAVTQTAPITASGIAVATVAGAVTLTNAGNDVSSLQITSGSQPASFTDKNAVSLSTIAAGAFTLRAGGAVTQTQAATTTSFDVATTLGGVTLGNAGNALGILSANLAATGAALTVVNNGLLRVAQVSTQGPIAISTLNGGNVNIGPAGTPAPKIQTTSTINFTGVTGGIVTANGGTIVAPGGVTVPTGKRIQWTLTSSADSGTGSLRDTLQMVNSLKAPSQITYTAPATINLASPLPTVTVPLAVIGKSQLTLNGSAAGSGANGLSFSNTAAGSLINGVTFQNFSGAGLNLTAAARTTVTAINVSNSAIGLRASGALASTVITSSTFIGNVQGVYLAGTGITFGLAGQGNVLTGNASTTAGIYITGPSSGTIVQGNAVSQATSGISIVSATGARIGGTLTGQFNSVSYATTGVFATGTCTGTSVVKTAFGPAVTTQYNTAGARGLSITK